MASLLAVVLPLSVASGQKTTTMHAGTGGSVHVRTEWTIGDAAITIEYGRPSLKGRALDVLIPQGRVWRAGADEATIFRTTRPLRFGKSTLAAGAYSLYAIPGVAEWQLVVNRQTGQWGTTYDERLDVMRVPMTVSVLSREVEQLTIFLDADADTGTLAIIWGVVRAEAQFRVMSSSSGARS